MAELGIEREALRATDSAQEKPGLERLLEPFEELRAYVRDTAEPGEGIVIQLS